MRHPLTKSVLVATLLMGVLAACSAPKTEAPAVEKPTEPAVEEAPTTKDLGEPIPVRVGWQPYNSVLYYTAVGLDLWSECGLDAELTKFTAGPPQFAAIESESTDVNLFGTAAMVWGLSQGLDMVNFYIQIESSYNDGLVVNPEAGIETVKDLAGKNVTFVRGSSAHLGLVRTLEANGMTIDDVNVITIEVPSLVPAFIAGDIDAAYSWEPWISRMEEAGGVVISRTNEVGLYTSDNWTVRRKWAEENPEGMRRVFCVIDKADAAYAEDPSIGVSTFAEETGITEEMAAKILALTPIVSLDDAADPNFELSFTNPAGAQAMVQEVIDFLFVDQELLPSQPDASVVVDGSYLLDYMKNRSDYIGG